MTQELMNDLSARLRWLIYSRVHNAFWGPDSGGYTYQIDKAGRYTKADAQSRCTVRKHDDGGPGEVAVIAPEAADEIDRLTSELAEARKVMEPFARTAKFYDGLTLDKPLYLEPYVTEFASPRCIGVANLRAAHVLLSRHKGERT